MNTLLAQHQLQIRQLCQRYGVERLDLFGSAATERFEAGKSDFDSIVGVNGGELFAPQSLGIYPIGIMSACWQGYVCHYKISALRLLLDQLRLTLSTYEESGK